MSEKKRIREKKTKRGSARCLRTHGCFLPDHSLPTSQSTLLSQPFFFSSERFISRKRISHPENASPLEPSDPRPCPERKKKEIPSDQDKKKETTMRRIRRRVLSRLREDGDAKRRTKIGSENIRSSSEPFPCTSRDHVLLSTSHVRINRVDRATNERNGSPRGRFRARTFAG